MESYISPKAKKGLQSPIHGLGLFAIEEIKKGEIVAVKGGEILTKQQLAAASTTLHAEMQIADDLFIAPKTEKDYVKSMMCLNHSCNPNLGIRGDIVFISMRIIYPGEELTVDYAMMDNVPSRFLCICGSRECRGEVTGQDWQKEEIQEKYVGYFSAYIASLITNILQSQKRGCKAPFTTEGCELENF